MTERTKKFMDWVNADDELPNPPLPDNDDEGDEDEHHEEHEEEEEEADDEVIETVAEKPKKRRIQIQNFRLLYIGLSAILAINIIVIMLITVNHLPEFGSADNPAVNEVFVRYVERGTEETAALNIVSAVLFSYRSFDTLGEALMLFAAAVAVIMLMKEN